MDSLIPASEKEMILPRTVYKYVGWKSEYSKRILTHQEIYFVKPKEFNDPFDVGIIPDYSLYTKEDWIKKFDELTRRSLSRGGYTKEHLEKETNRYLKYEIWRDTDKLGHMSHVMLQSYRENGGIFCTTSRFGHPLMWSHYADSHKGICIGFNTQLLKNDSDCLMIGEVHYLDSFKIPLIVPDIGDSPREFIEIFTKKSPVWTYEKEIRLLKLPMTEQVVKLSKRAISEIIFGCAMESSDKRKIYEIIKSDEEFDHLNIYSAHKRAKSFLLRVNKYNPKTKY